MPFEQATIRVQKQEEFAKLQGFVEQAFLPDRAERFLKRLDRKGIRIRDFDAILSARALEEALRLAESEVSPRQLYKALPLQIRRRCVSFICRSWRRWSRRYDISSRRCISIISARSAGTTGSLLALRARSE